MRVIAFIQYAHSITDIMKAQRIPDFQAPSPLTRPAVSGMSDAPRLLPRA